MRRRTHSRDNAFNPPHLRLKSVLGEAARNVLLVALALCVCQVVALVGVDGEAQFALVGPQVVAHEVRILVEIHSLQRQLA
jgi:hypothetical protein